MDKTIIQALERSAKGFVAKEQRKTVKKNPDGTETITVEQIEREVAPNVSAAILLREIEQNEIAVNVNTLSSFQTKAQLLGGDCG